MADRVSSSAPVRGCWRDPDARTQLAADQMVLWLARRMKDMKKVQVGVNAPIAECAALLACKIATDPPSVYMGAMAGVLWLPTTVNVFRTEWDAVAHGDSFPFESLIDLLSGWEGVDEEPVHPLQVDRWGNVNLSGIVDSQGVMTVVGPGPAGVDLLPNILVGRPTVYLPRHTRRTVVDTVSMVTSPGGRAQDLSDRRAWSQLTVLTNLCVLSIDRRGVKVVSRHPGVSGEEIIENTGFEGVDDVETSVVTTPPSSSEIELLNEVDPRNLRILEFLPLSERIAYVLEMWDVEFGGMP